MFVTSARKITTFVQTVVEPALKGHSLFVSWENGRKIQMALKYDGASCQ